MAAPVAAYIYINILCYVGHMKHSFVVTQWFIKCCINNVKHYRYTPLIFALLTKEQKFFD